MGEKLSDDEEQASGDQLRKIMGMLVVTVCICRFSFLTDLDDGAWFDLVCNLLHLREQLCSFRRVDTELSRRESQNTVIDFRELLDFFLDLCGAVCAVDVFHYIDGADRFRILWADLNDGAGLDLISNLLHLREQLCSHGRVDPELSRRESQNTVIDFRELLDLFLDLCGAVRAVDVFHHVDHTGGFRCRTVVVFGVLMMMFVLVSASASAVLFVSVIVLFVMVMMSASAVLVVFVIVLFVMVMMSASTVLVVFLIVLFVMVMMSASAVLVIIIVLVMMVVPTAAMLIVVIIVLVMMVVPTAAVLIVIIIVLMMMMMLMFLVLIMLFVMMVSAAANLFVLVVC